MCSAQGLSATVTAPKNTTTATAITTSFVRQPVRQPTGPRMRPSIPRGPNRRVRGGASLKDRDFQGLRARPEDMHHRRRVEPMTMIETAYPEPGCFSSSRNKHHLQPRGPVGRVD